MLDGRTAFMAHVALHGGVRSLPSLGVVTGPIARPCSWKADVQKVYKNESFRNAWCTTRVGVQIQEI